MKQSAPESDQASAIPAQRLCSEIQLFDLCDADVCRSKSGRFCTNSELLKRFEKIADEEIRVPERFISEEYEDEADDGDDAEYDMDCEGEDFERGGEWEDEE